MMVAKPMQAAKATLKNMMLAEFCVCSTSIWMDERMDAW